MLTILFDGIAYGMLLFILAVGLSVTMGLMNFINLAHGAFAMVDHKAVGLRRQPGQHGLPGADVAHQSGDQDQCGLHLALPGSLTSLMTSNSVFQSWPFKRSTLRM